MVQTALLNKDRIYKRNRRKRSVRILGHNWGMKPRGIEQTSSWVTQAFIWMCVICHLCFSCCSNCWLTAAPNIVIAVTFYLASQQRGCFNPFLPLRAAPYGLNWCSFWNTQRSQLSYTSFSDELADRSTSWASKNSETDSDMESRLSLEACWVRGIPICSPVCRKNTSNTRDVHCALLWWHV